MSTASFTFTYEVVSDDKFLSEEDQHLLRSARSITRSAYAIYSGFSVGAAAKLTNGSTIQGTNQENASYPVGICAERALLAAAGSTFPDIPIETMAISYWNQRAGFDSDHPLSPCGMCRQALLEYENRTHHPIRIILSGQTGQVVIINKALDLLPLAYSGKELREEKAKE
jgi:cytidine deaminase